MDTEMDNYRKNIAQEQLHNEQLTLMLNKAQADINHVQHLIDQCSIKKEALKTDYMMYTRALQETEQALAHLDTVSVTSCGMCCWVHAVCLSDEKMCVGWLFVCESVVMYVCVYIMYVCMYVCMCVCMYHR